MDYKTAFSESFKVLKGTKSTNQIAKESGIPQTTLSGYETCTSEARLSSLWLLAEYFNCTIDELVGKK